MSKYIKAEDLRTALLQRSFYPAIVAYELEHMPAADVVQVVRCENCAFSNKQIEFKNLYVCLQNERFVKKNDFCSYGERKDDENL